MEISLLWKNFNTSEKGRMYTLLYISDSIVWKDNFHFTLAWCKIYNGMFWISGKDQENFPVMQ